MCGIAGTIYSRAFKKGVVVEVEQLLNILEGFENDNGKVEALLDKCWQYKSNVNFLRYCKDVNEKEQIELLCVKIKVLSDKYFDDLPKIDKSKTPQLFNSKYYEYQQLLDCHWFLSVELGNWSKQIIFLAGCGFSEIDDTAVIFYKNLVSVINSIDNRLEIRGRDSLGLSIQLSSATFNDILTENISSKDNSESIYYEKFINREVVTLVFKVANSIGSLGDNARIIKEKIKNCEVLRDIILENKADYATIVAHTRWASVGEVNISNCHPISNSIPGKELNHPLILASLNGDIYNYNEITIAESKRLNDIQMDNKCTTDCKAIPISLTGPDNLSLNSLKDIFKTYTGSFAVAVQGFTIPDEIILSNSGTQGLYMGFSYDNVMFSSDVYGLVETCRYFYPIKSGSILTIPNHTPVYSDNFKFEIEKLDSNKVQVLERGDLKTTNITTRDIDKKEYAHFLEKEIYETKDIVQRTILGYLQAPGLIADEDFHNAIIIDESQVPAHIIERLKNGSIKEIIITGMGTCYTASVAIARYMRDMFRHYFRNIKVEPHIASEGSGFYLKPNMGDILVIVVAQSGTTVDTNVYVQMAKDRGAMSLAIANKREGDVTFIVDGTLYIGSGRDIEIAVPSTKTYTAQVILGYILTLYFCGRLNENPAMRVDLSSHIGLLRGVPELIDKTFEQLDASKDVFKTVQDYAIKFNSWYLTFDNSANSVCAMEIRIKYSEGCYHSLPYLHISEILKSKITNSFITYISNQHIEEIKDDLLEILNRGNSLIVIMPFKELLQELAGFVEEGRLSFIKIPFMEPSFYFLPTIIAGQLLSYYAAVALDERKEHFEELIEAVESNNGIDTSWHKLITELKSGTFNQGFSISNFSHLKELYENAKKSKFETGSKENCELLSFLGELYQFSRRPIDTIKHQAKTITVGAIRDPASKLVAEQITLMEGTVSHYKNSVNEINKLTAAIINYEDNELAGTMKQFKEFLICMNEMDESYGYSIVGFLNEFSNKHNLDLRFKLAQHYDLPTVVDTSKSFWVFLCKKDMRMPAELIANLDKNQYIIFDFSADGDNTIVRHIPKFYSTSGRSINYSLGSLYVACVLAKLSSGPDALQSSWKPYFIKELGQLEKSWNYIMNSKQLNDEIHDAMKVFLTRRNWKCLGSGVNYNVAKFAAKKLISDLNRACAFDVLENHKHIDMSAEGSILIFIANIWRHGYQEDVMSEVEKLISHGNMPIVVTNHGDDRFDDMLTRVNFGTQKEMLIPVPVIKLPKVSEIFSFPLNILLINKTIGELITISRDNNRDLFSKIALIPPSNLKL